ncbi:MAG: hypothetical protein WC502_05470 [Methanolinea sp.]|jgi:hypothetical protein
MDTTGMFETFMRDADEHVTGCTMGKGIIIAFVLLSLLICSCGAAYIQNPLAEHGRFQKDARGYIIPAGVHPGIISNFIYPSDHISRSEAVSIAKANAGLILIYSISAKCEDEWSELSINPVALTWVVILKGRVTRSYDAELVTKVVRIDGFTGKVISVT